MAGLNDHEALGIVVTASLLNALAQMRSISHALVSTLQKQKNGQKRQNLHDLAPCTSGP